MLKYLFQATYKDGSIYKQNKEDRSLHHAHGSSYTDVKQDQLKSFFLFDNKNTFSVNLEDGHFEVNGVPFFMHANDALKNYRLIYFRNVQQHLTMQIKDRKEISREQTQGRIIYLLGWQTNDEKGNNIQRVMEIQ